MSGHSKRSFSITAESNIENDPDIGEIVSDTNNVSITRKTKSVIQKKRKRNAASH